MPRHQLEMRESVCAHRWADGRKFPVEKTGGWLRRTSHRKESRELWSSGDVASFAGGDFNPATISPASKYSAVPLDKIFKLFLLMAFQPPDCSCLNMFARLENRRVPTEVLETRTYDANRDQLQGNRFLNQDGREVH